jgi:putative transposase
MAPSPRKRKGKSEKETKSPLALTTEERQKVLDLLHCEKYVDQAPNAIYASLLDHGQYFCSVRTMYRYLSQEGEIKERRNQKRHVKYEKPELLASKPNQLWSWDITKLKGPKKWNYFHLYVIMDVYSRYVVGWMVANKEQAVLAQQFISETAVKQGISAKQLTIPCGQRFKHEIEACGASDE